MMEVLRVVVDKHKEAGIEMDVEVKFLVSNAVTNLENYKGTKIDFKI